MSIERKKLLWLALVTLDEIVEQGYRESISPSFRVRLALAVAYTHSNGDRRPFDQFWREMQELHEYDEHKSGYLRRTRMQGCLNRIQELTGWGVAPADHDALRVWRKGERR